MMLRAKNIALRLSKDQQMSIPRQDKTRQDKVNGMVRDELRRIPKTLGRALYHKQGKTLCEGRQEGGGKKNDGRVILNNVEMCSVHLYFKITDPIVCVTNIIVLISHLYVRKMFTRMWWRGSQKRSENERTHCVIKCLNSKKKHIRWKFNINM